MLDVGRRAACLDESDLITEPGEPLAPGRLLLLDAELVPHAPLQGSSTNPAIAETAENAIAPAAARRWMSRAS